MYFERHKITFEYLDRLAIYFFIFRFGINLKNVLFMGFWVNELSKNVTRTLNVLQKNK